MKALLFSLLFCFSAALLAQTYQISSPSGAVSADISVDEKVVFTLNYKHQIVLEPTTISMQIGRLTAGTKSHLKSAVKTTKSEKRTLIVSSKDRVISGSFEELILRFREGFSIEFRAYDDGLAYRFVTALGSTKSVEVFNETLNLDFPKGSTSWFPKEKSLYSHFEQHYDLKPLSEVAEGDFAALPVRFDTPAGVGLLITEADQFDYPGLFLEKAGLDDFQSKFPKVVEEIVPLEKRPDRYEVIKKEAPFIAKTVGTRSYPWRVLMVSDDDRTFVESNLVMQLSRPSVLKETSWIKPGKIAWDWYNANNVYGVDFESGINNATYKYYIDFAAKYALEYVILDEGWTKTTTDVMAYTSEINIPELVAYGKERGVSLILWLLWHPLDKNMDEILKLYSSWGVQGIKVDFMQRADQYMVKSYERIAATAAKYQLMVDFHGAFKPAGLRSAYPNVMTYEGVMGNENNKWGKDITPEHNVTLPFTRMVAGPMDYTPGAMANAQAKNFHISFDRPMSQGTRCHQAAMYVVFESPLQMLCDAPSAYLKAPDFTNFIAQIPADWDETRVIHGKIGEYIAVARRKGDQWYIGAMTNSESRTLELDLSFLPKGSYQLNVLKDGINAAKYAEDYKLETVKLSESKILNIQMAPGGGWVGIIGVL